MASRSAKDGRLGPSALVFPLLVVTFGVGLTVLGGQSLVAKYVEGTAYGMELSVALFGALFAALGVLFVLAVLEDILGRWPGTGPAARWLARLRASQAPASVAPPRFASYREAAPRPRSPDDPGTAGRIETTAGTTLPFRLRGEPAPGGWASVAFAVVGCASVPLLFVVALLVSEAVPLLGAALWGLSVLLLVLPFAREAAATRRARRGVPLVEVDAEPATLGTPLAVHVAIAGPGTLERVEVAVERRAAGAPAGPPAATFPADPVDARRRLAAGETWTHAWSVPLPDRFATDPGDHWCVAVRWVVGVRQAAARYPLRVLPRSTLAA